MKIVKDSKGITLVALVITVIILLILAGISISVLLGENGLINRAKQGGQDYKNAAEDEEDILKKYLGLFGDGASAISNNEEENVVNISDNDSILGYISKNINETGYYDNVSINGETYNFHAIVINQDAVFNGINTFDGISLSCNKYEIGNASTDVATSGDENNKAKYSVVLKVNGSMQVNDGVEVTSCKDANGYGGPKGLFIFVSDSFVNNGKVSMTERGAYANGQNVYLWKNLDGTYEFIPQDGATGGNGNSGTSGDNGNDASTATKRATGGGGAGGAYGNGTGGKGATGTSYSGGTGGGAGGNTTGQNGFENGGKGGNGVPNGDRQYDGGGAGNPGGSKTYGNSYDGANGTGGTLVIYSKNIENNGIFESKGSNGGNGDDAAGGASGGGSINLFYTNKSKITGLNIVDGGLAGSGYGTGGHGGLGSANITKLNANSYMLCENEFIYKVVQADSLLDGIKNINEDGYYAIIANNEVYKSHVYVYNSSQEWNENIEFGDQYDVSKFNYKNAREYAKNTIIVKVNGDLTIGQDVTISTVKSEEGLGGPKGMVIYCTGDLINNGDISMTQRGAYAISQDVYLLKNGDGSYEYIPKDGAAGGEGNNDADGSFGSMGYFTTKRSTGGGGAGGGYFTIGGSGANGTAYSGGTAGGAGGRKNGQAGQINGGYGGSGTPNDGNQYDGGGAGNPGGKKSYGNSYDGENGTGGTLILYGKNVENNGMIESKGSNGGNGSDAAGGGSGGGSVNIFYDNTYSETGSHNLNGGLRGTGEKNGGYGGAGSITVTKTNGNTEWQYVENYLYKLINAESLIDCASKINANGFYKVSIKDEIYTIHAYVYNGNQTWNEDMEFGVEQDVSFVNYRQERQYARNMILVKVNGDLTIGSTTTVTSVASNSGLGGPKGMMVYCSGNIENNGTITMTGRGAYALGQKVYLWKNNENSYETIPQDGATGGNGNASSSGSKGNDGSDVNSRATGGGGAGGGYNSTGGKGAQGTSYSGGTGGGAGGRMTGQDGFENGGKGGNGMAANGSQYNGGGAGNPGGTKTYGPCEDGKNGTGGTLIIYGKNITNNELISADGCDGGYGGDSSGGASGGGSINIFYQESFNQKKDLHANGGTGGTSGQRGGNGGNGTVSRGKIINGVYTND